MRAISLQQKNIISNVYKISWKYFIPIIGLYFYVFNINKQYQIEGVSTNHQKRLIISSANYYLSWFINWMFIAIIPFILTLSLLDSSALLYVILSYSLLLIICLPLIFIASIHLSVKINGYHKTDDENEKV